jgi:MFS family permease
MKLAKPFFLPSEPVAAEEPPTRAATENDPLLPHTPPDPNAAEGAETAIPTKVKQRRPAILALGVSPELFVVLSILLTFSSGHSPAANSLALTLVGDSRQSGRLFGGIAVIQALGASLVGPLMYGGLFSATVATFAEGIFVMAACGQFVAFVLFMCVRLPEGKEEETKAERGRSKRVKTVRSSSVGQYTAVEGDARGKSAVRGQGGPRQETVVE